MTERMQRDLWEVLAWQTEEVYWALLGCSREVCAVSDRIIGIVFELSDNVQHELASRNIDHSTDATIEVLVEHVLAETLSETRGSLQPKIVENPVPLRNTCRCIPGPWDRS